MASGCRGPQRENDQHFTIQTSFKARLQLDCNSKNQDSSGHHTVLVPDHTQSSALPFVS